MLLLSGDRTVLGFKTPMEQLQEIMGFLGWCGPCCISVSLTLKDGLAQEPGLAKI